jgi:DNA topoisomerase VI subunit A
MPTAGQAIFQTLQAELEPRLPEAKPLLICGKGYPDSNSRGLLCAVCDALPANKPVFCLVDGDVSVS